MVMDRYGPEQIKMKETLARRRILAQKLKGIKKLPTKIL